MKIQLSKTQWEHIGRTAGWLQRKASMTATVKYEITYLGDPWDAMVNIVVTKVGNNGIGPYEFWGSRGFDKGSNFVEGFEIEDIEIPGLDLPEEEKLMIIEGLKIDEAFAEKVSEDVDVDELAKDDYEPPEYLWDSKD